MKNKVNMKVNTMSRVILHIDNIKHNPGPLPLQKQVYVDVL